MVTTQTASLLLVLPCTAAAKADPRLRCLAGAAAAPVYAVHSQKRFAMAGIDTNVWPLSPREWTSG